MCVKVLYLSWEFPPQVVGGLGTHVYELSRCMTELGVEPHIITPRVQGTEDCEYREGVYIHRTGAPVVLGRGFKAWAFGFNKEIIRKAVELCDGSVCFDLIHAHDWMVAYAARLLSQEMGIPLITTIHATEHGRNQGLHNRMQREIHDTELNLALESQRIICCSEFMRQEIHRLFGVDCAKIQVIPNGVSWPQKSLNEMQSIKISGINEEDRLIFFIGRLVPEKGVLCLLKAVSRLVKEVSNVKLVIAGQGPQGKFLKQQAEELGIEDRVLFTGFIKDEVRDWFYQKSEVAVFPSLYEPFGIVALEAMAAGTPVIVSNVGGLAEIIEDGITGLKVSPDNDEELAAALKKVLDDRNLADQLKRNAFQSLKERYSWPNIAQKTVEIYDMVVSRRAMRR